ncbi:MAG: type IV pilus biogenesis/stability protein PilW [Oceanospirillaceae bacterium]|nr:type IV pilus biogenesis/stability protein PilW [Oceanospirillaceae bacterium]
MHKFKSVAALLAVLLLLTGCAIGAKDPNKVDSSEKAKSFTDVAIAHLKNRDNVSARNWLQKALKYDDKYARAYSVLATVFQSEKEFELAEQYFKKSIAVDPDASMFHNNYGAFLFARERYAEACVELEFATKDPFYNRRANALNNLGRCYAALKQKSKAGKAFQRSVNLGGRSSFALLNISNSLLEAGETFKSNAKYQEFLELVTQNQAHHTAESLILGVNLARANGDLSEVVTYSILLENLFPKKYKKFKESAQ